MTFDLWTLGFQTVNVLVLVWLLQRFLWKPVAAMIAERQEKAATLLQQAETKRAEAETALAGVESKRKGLAVERDGVLATARKDAEAARAALLDTAKAEANTWHDMAEAARARAAETLKKTAMEDAQELALTIASQLAARLNGPATDAAFMVWLVEGLAALSDADRKALAGADLKVVSAADADTKAQDRIAKAITKVLGAPVTLTFRTDPALIAGHELHSPHFTLRNSWRADLARIAAKLARPDTVQEGGALPDAT